MEGNRETLTNADNDVMDKDWFFWFSSMFGLRGRALDLINKTNMDIRHTQYLNLSIFFLSLASFQNFLCVEPRMKLVVSEFYRGEDRLAFR